MDKSLQHTTGKVDGTVVLGREVNEDYRGGGKIDLPKRKTNRDHM